MRTQEIIRKTNETDITLKINLDGRGNAEVKTGVGFLDHMLSLFAKNAGVDLAVSAVGDTYVDFHHTTEDVGIALGEAIKGALSDKRGIKRYSSVILPMDEALVLCAIDISGRGYLGYSLDIPAEKVGDFDTELCEEFFMALARSAAITLHLKQLDGRNSHHIIEAAFKAFGRAVREAASIDERFADEIPSTKGAL